MKAKAGLPLKGRVLFASEDFATVPLASATNPLKILTSQ
jgi:hypothetical protein